MEKLFKDMTPDEQMRWLTDFKNFSQEKMPLLEQLGDSWEACDVKSIKEGLTLLNAFQFARDFVEKSLRYGDYSARVKRVRFYLDLIEKKIQAGEGVKGVGGDVFALVPKMQPQGARRGRPASQETLARREAEARAAEQQKELFGESDKTPAAGTAQQDNDSRATAPTASQGTSAVSPFISPVTLDGAEYKLSIAQKRAFLSPDLQKLADQIRALRTTAGAAAEKAKTMAELKASPDLIAPVSTEAQRTLEQVEQIYQEIDYELAEIWYRLQNGSPEWKAEWCKRYGYKEATDLHPDLVHDLKKHYKKVTEKRADFEAQMRIRIEQESPAFVEKQKREAADKKEVQDILRYLRRKDKSQKVETARTKYARLVELLGKNEAATYKPLLTKIEEDAKKGKKTKQ